MKSVLVAALLTAALTAGCASSGNGGTSADPTFATGGATDKTGVIHGIVYDQRLVPLSNATAKITTKNLSQKTDDQGRFSFEKLDPGTYFIEAGKPGFATLRSSGVTVVAGEDNPPITKIILTADGSTKPFYLQTHHTGFISCGFKTANYVWDASSCDPTGAAGYAARDDSAPHFAIDSPPRYLQTEVSWQSTQTLGNGLVIIESPCETMAGPCYSDYGTDTADQERICNIRGATPLICRITLDHSGSADDDNGRGLNESRLGQADRNAFEVAVFANCFTDCVLGAVGLGVELEQTFEVYNTYFYGYEPPADWSFVATGKVPAPPK